MCDCSLCGMRECDDELNPAENLYDSTCYLADAVVDFFSTLGYYLKWRITGK